MTRVLPSLTEPDPMLARVVDPTLSVACFSAAMVFGGFGLAASPAHAQGPPQESQTQSSFQPRRLLPPQPAITQPPLIGADQVQGQVTDSELVLGVEVNGEPRAYPINMLTGPSREIINDTSGGVEIAAMWCHLCHSGIVFDRTVHGQTLTFVVSGMLWNRTLVMMDVETNSLWSLLLMRAMSGPLEGQRPAALPSEMTTWDAWRSEHPQTTVLNMPRTSRDFVKQYYDAAEQFVYGIATNGNAYHVSLSTLKQNPVLNVNVADTPLVVTFDPESAAVHLFSRNIDEQTLSFTARDDSSMQDRETGTIWDRSTGQAREGRLQGQTLEPRAGSLAFARAWRAFYPDSRNLQP